MEPPPPRGGPARLVGALCACAVARGARAIDGVPERRVVFRGVDWAFYEQLVDSIPEWSNIHVDYDGKDLEVMGKRRRHERWRRLIASTGRSDCTRNSESITAGVERRRGNGRSLRGVWRPTSAIISCPEKIAADAAALDRDSDDIADYPNPDLAIEVDLSPPQVDRAGIYAALRVAEVWRFDGRTVVIDRLMADGTYKPRRREPLPSDPA